MNPDVLLFWFLSIITLISAVTVVTITNPVFSALFLAMTMVGVSALFVTLNAYFLAGVQLIVYAGAVTVLFVMVLMLFDLKHEVMAFVRGKISGFFKMAFISVLGGLIVGAIVLSASDILSGPPAPMATSMGGDTTKELGRVLFSKYVFSFEILGVLLLVVAVGTVALSRSKGGTHAK